MLFFMAKARFVSQLVNTLLNVHGNHEAYQRRGKGGGGRE